jgi:hypothetical protein
VDAYLMGDDESAALDSAEDAAGKASGAPAPTR